MKQFLSSDWKNVFLITWEVEPELLIEHLPHKVGLYTENGKAWVSLVTYHSDSTRVRGIKMPFHVSFPEMDLRFYVKYKEQVGFSFIQNIVPRYCVSLWAKRIFNASYVTLPMDCTFNQSESSKISHYKIWKNRTLFSIDFITNQEVEPINVPILNQSSWIFGIDKYGNPIQYKFEKPQDLVVYTSLDYILNIDFAFLYGKKWGFLGEQKSVHAFAMGDVPIRIAKPQPLFLNENNNLEYYLKNPENSLNTPIIKEL